jgi:hypothetical protein
VLDANEVIHWRTSDALPRTTLRTRMADGRFLTADVAAKARARHKQMCHDPDGPSAAEIRRAIEVEADTLSAPPQPDGRLATR